MRLKLTVLLAVLLPCFLIGQDSLDSEAVKDSLSVWLSPGEFTARLMNGNTGGVRVEELSLKMSMAIQENQKWYLNFVKKIPEGEVMPYHKNIGLTESEYDELLILIDEIQPAATSEGTIHVTSTSDKIGFSATGEFQALNLLQFDKASNSFFFIEDGESSPPLILYESIDAGTGKTGPYSKWHGYEWRYAEGVPTDEEFEKLKDFSDLSFSEYTVTVGKSTNGDVVFKFKITIMHQGQMVANNELPLLIK